MGRFLDSNMNYTNNLTIKQQTYRIINVLNGANVDFFLNLCLYGLKFGMVRLDACIDAMGGFLESTTTDTNNSSIKKHT